MAQPKKQTLCAVLFCVTLGVVCVFLLVLRSSVGDVGFYVPYLSPVDHYVGDTIPIMANSLRSLETIVPYDYYHGPFCVPPVIRTNPPSLGSMITGESLKTSPYSVTMLRNEPCKEVDCTHHDLSKSVDTIEELTRLIDDGYRGFLSLENLPMFNHIPSIFGGSCRRSIPLQQRRMNMRGYALGIHHECVGQTLVNNHIHFVADYHETISRESGRIVYRIVGFKGAPYSINYQKSKLVCNDDGDFDVYSKHIIPLTVGDMAQSDYQPKWTYSVSWVRKIDVSWANRWHEFLSTNTVYTNSSTIRWQYIAVNIVLNKVLFAVAYILVRHTMLRQAGCTQQDDLPAEVDDDETTEVGCNQIHTDVFRPPHHAKLLCLAVGNGGQLMCMIIVVLCMTLTGLLSPAARGWLLNCIIVTYVMMAFPGGYACGKLLKMFGLKADWRCVMLCGGSLPGAAFVCYTIINVRNWYVGASSALPLVWMVALFLWSTVNIPLAYFGIVIAFNQPVIQSASNATIIRHIPTTVPLQRFFNSAHFIYVFPPCIPMMCILMETIFIFSSIWLDYVLRLYVLGTHFNSLDLQHHTHVDYQCVPPG